jgi:hypothetical protein
MRMLKLAFAICLLAGVSLALQWGGSATSNVRYDGGSIATSCIGEPRQDPFDLYANILHTLTVNASLTQNGVEPAEFSSGPANLDIRVTTNTSIGAILASSSLNFNQNAQPSPAAANLAFDNAEYSYISSKYPVCINEDPSRPDDRGVHYLNYIYGSATCNHAMSAADAVTVNVGYKPCMAGPVSGMGKGYMYCTGGTLKVNGLNAGTFSSSQQSFSTTVNLATGTTSIPVSVTYQCYFVLEKYLNTGDVQPIEHLIYQMPGGVPITQTVNIPINRVNPPQINLVPFITLNNTNYYTGTHVTVNKVNTKFDISFFVNRTDNLVLIETPYLNWSITSTPPELITRTYRDFKLVPPLTVGTPHHLVPSGTTPPITITVCRPGFDTDTITLNINQWRSIIESSYDDNSITITFDCSSLDNPMCTFNPSTLITYPGQTKMTNMSCYDKRTMEPMDCPSYSDASITHANGEFSSHYLPLAWTYDISENATNLVNVTAIGGTNPDEGTYSDTVTATFPGSYVQPFSCKFNLEWGRPDCRYYM